MRLFASTAYWELVTDMQCLHCSTENAEPNSFCIGCGNELAPVESGEDDISQAQQQDIKPQLKDLQAQINRIKAVLSDYGIVMDQAARIPSRSAAGPAVAGKPTRSLDQWLSEKINWEPIIGGNWLARIGALTVVIGIGFFLALAFDNNWINEGGRVVLGTVTGFLFLGIGEYWRTKYAVYSQALTGAGIAVIYLAIFAAFALYSLIDIYTGIGVFLLISLGSALLAIRDNSMALAIIGIFGAFFGPFLLGGFSESDITNVIGPPSNAIALLAYIFAVDVGVIVLSMFRTWSWFTALALLGSLVTFGIWHQEFVLDSRVLLDAHGHKTTQLIAESGAVAIFLSFVAATILFHIVWRRRPQPIDISVMMVNATTFMAISYGLLWTEFRDWMGLFTLLVALLYGGVGYVSYRRFGMASIDPKEPLQDTLLTFISLGIATIFLTIALPVQIGGPWVPVAWTTEAIVLLWIAFRQRMPEIRYASYLVFLLGAMWLVLVDTPNAFTASLTPIFNRYLPVYVLVIVGLWNAAYLVRRYSSQLKGEEKIVFPILAIAGVFFLALGTPTQVDNSWMAFSWAVEGVVITWVSLRLGIFKIQLAGLGLLGLAAVRAMGFDSIVSSDGYTVLWNTRSLAFGPLIIAVALSAYFWSTMDLVARSQYKASVVIVLAVSGNILALWFLSSELIGAVQADAIFNVITANEGNLISLGLTVLWAAYGGLALTAGFIGGWRWVRVGSLVLLGITVFKLFLIDSFQLEQGFRVASFLMLGAILLGGGYLYQRYTETFTELFLPQRSGEG
jgi:uncharacterized membrane protein